MSPGPIQLDQATALTLMLGPNGSVGIQARKKVAERTETGDEIEGGRKRRVERRRTDDAMVLEFPARDPQHPAARVEPDRARRQPFEHSARAAAQIERPPRPQALANVVGAPFEKCRPACETVSELRHYRESYLFTADAGVGAGQKRPPRLSYSACSGPGGSRFANWANGLNGLRASWVD